MDRTMHFRDGEYASIEYCKDVDVEGILSVSAGKGPPKQPESDMWRQQAASIAVNIRLTAAEGRGKMVRI